MCKAQRPTGELHHRAKFSDREVELMRRMYDDGMKQREIAMAFEASRSTVAKIVTFERRNTRPDT